MRSWSVVIACGWLSACGQDAPQPIPVGVPGQVPPGMPVQPLTPVAAPVPAPPLAPAPFAPGVPGTSLVPGQISVAPLGPPTTLVPGTPGTALVPGQVNVPPPPPTVPPPPPGADPRAAERMREYTIEMIATGYLPHGAPGADTLGQNGSRNFQITMNGGDCYTIAGFGGAGVRDLDAYLHSPSGQQLKRDFARDSRPIVRSCATETGSYRVRFHMYSGGGPYTYQVYRAPGAAVQAEGLAGIDPVVRRRMDLFTASRVAKGFRAVPGMAGSGILSTNQVQNFTANLDTGRCYSFAGFGGSGVRDLDIFVYGPGGNENHARRGARRDARGEPLPERPGLRSPSKSRCSRATVPGPTRPTSRGRESGAERARLPREAKRLPVPVHLHHVARLVAAARISSASGSCSSFRMARFRGRAPKAGS